MFIELVDALRCPTAHEESWLVLSTAQMNARHVVEGTLGCPVCRAEYPIHNGVADFRGGAGQVSTPAPHAATDAERLAAFLNLSDGSGMAVLLGAWAHVAHELAAIVETPIILVDPPAGVEGAPGISVVLTSGKIPMAAAVARGVAIDGDRVEEALRIAKTSARIVGPVAVAIPGDVRLLAQDELLWVAEREAVSSAPVALHVRRSL